MSEEGDGDPGGMKQYIEQYNNISSLSGYTNT